MGDEVEDKAKSDNRKTMGNKWKQMVGDTVGDNLGDNLGDKVGKQWKQCGRHIGAQAKRDAQWQTQLGTSWRQGETRFEVRRRSGRLAGRQSGRHWKASFQDVPRFPELCTYMPEEGRTQHHPLLLEIETQFLLLGTNHCYHDHVGKCAQPQAKQQLQQWMEEPQNHCDENAPFKIRPLKARTTNFDRLATSPAQQLIPPCIVILFLWVKPCTNIGRPGGKNWRCSFSANPCHLTGLQVYCKFICGAPAFTAHPLPLRVALYAQLMRLHRPGSKRKPLDT